MTLDGIKGNIGGYYVAPFKKADSTEKKEDKKTAFTGQAEKEDGGEQVMNQLAAMALNNKPIFQKTKLAFDPQALDAQIGSLDQSTQDGLAALSNPKTLAMFAGMTKQLEASKHNPAEVLAMQSNFLAEFA